MKLLYVLITWFNTIRIAFLVYLYSIGPIAYIVNNFEGAFQKTLTLVKVGILLCSDIMNDIRPKKIVCLSFPRALLLVLRGSPVFCLFVFLFVWLFVCLFVFCFFVFVFFFSDTQFIFLASRKYVKTRKPANTSKQNSLPYANLPPSWYSFTWAVRRKGRTPLMNGSIGLHGKKT